MAKKTNILQLQQRIDRSRKASAVERAWKVAKTLEDRHQIAGLTWVTPVQSEKSGITRKIDFERDFPQGVDALVPLSMKVGVHAPANVLVPGEGMDFNWTMPLLTRLHPARPVPKDVRDMLGVRSIESRPTVEIVTFLPFPRTDAPPEEQFTPEFFVTLDIDRRHLCSDGYFVAIVRFGDKLVSQFVRQDRTSIIVSADPFHETLFRAEMLVNLSETELEKTPDQAGTLEIFVYQVTKAPNIPYITKDLGRIFDFGDYLDKGYAQRQEFSFDIGLRRGDAVRDRPITVPDIVQVIRGGGQKPSLPDAQEVAKEVGDTRVTEGTRGEAVDYGTIEGYGVDTSFAIATLSIRCLGVREAAREATIQALEAIASQS